MCICTDFWISGRTNGTFYPLLRGDNRGTWAKPPNGQADRYRVNVSINFAKHRADITIARSTDLTGNDVGPDQDLGSRAEWHGSNSVTVSVAARCGGCPNFGPFIRDELTYTLHPDGSVTVDGLIVQYPNIEVYQYGPSGTHELFERDAATYFGPLGLEMPHKHVSF